MTCPHCGKPIYGEPPLTQEEAESWDAAMRSRVPYAIGGLFLMASVAAILLLGHVAQRPRP